MRCGLAPVSISPRLRGLLAALAFLAAVTPTGAFVTFESGQVRPLALSPDGTKLFAVNTPDARLEIFDVDSAGLAHVGSVPVGMEPVAVAARTNDEVWVVNHLSDSVSIVDVPSLHVVQTLPVGDEPRDIVFGGPGRQTAFVTTAHRGQNAPYDPQLTAPGVGRANVWTFGIGPFFGGVAYYGPILTLFSDTPRALATSPDGLTVYAAAFQSGNQTTTLSEGVVCNGGAAAPPCLLADGITTVPGGLPAPNTNYAGVLGPETGLIVKVNPASGHWEDQLARNWDAAVRFSLPDKDVFVIDAHTFSPTVSSTVAHVGTVLFNMAVNPVNGKIYVSNTDARNEVRFEGPGVFGGSTVRGHLHESRITVIDGATVTPRHLNKHIDYGVVPSPPGVKEKSLATPTGMAVSSDGATLYVAAFGSSKVGVFSTAALEDDSFVPDAADHVTVTGGGPSGLVLDEAHDHLYVLTRFDNSVSVIDTGTKTEVAHLALFNPEPPSVVQGRRFLYDATFTSSNGEASCSSCHVFGDFDSLGWDLGNPDNDVTPNPNPIRVPDPLGSAFVGFHPMKGPMTTQSLRGMANDGPMHWRGDRTGGSTGGDPLDEDAAFKAFNVAFGGLLGRDGPLSATEMQQFTDFVLQITYPPNPIRSLDNILTPDQAAGRDFYFNSNPSDVFQTCNGCHKLDPANGHFGTDGFTSFENEPQILKIPHLRNLYQKVGMFGMPPIGFLNPGDNDFKGDQVRGFGFLHDGSVDTVFRFHNAVVFNQFTFGPFSNTGGFPPGPDGDTLRRQVEAFVLAFDSNMAPIVGQQTTYTSNPGQQNLVRIQTTLLRARAGECDVIVKGNRNGIARGWFSTGTTFRSDRAAEPMLNLTQLLAQVQAGGELTFTAVPPGSGIRMGIDRDEDGTLDRDELDAGTDPTDPSSNQPLAGRSLVVKNVLPDNEAKNSIVFASKDPAIPVASPGGAGDPRCGTDPPGTVKARVTVLSTTSGQSHTTGLPCQNWKTIGQAGNPQGYKYLDRELDDGTVKTVTWKRGKTLKVAIQGKGPTTLAYDLQTGVSQNPINARLVVGPIRLCIECNAIAGKNGVDGKKFLAKPADCPRPTTCPAGSPSGAFLDEAE